MVPDTWPTRFVGDRLQPRPLWSQADAINISGYESGGLAGHAIIGQEVVDVAEPRESGGISRRPKILDQLGGGFLPEDMARSHAEAVVRLARSGTGRTVEGPAPDPDEARVRRESRQEN